MVFREFVTEGGCFSDEGFLEIPAVYTFAFGISGGAASVGCFMRLDVLKTRVSSTPATVNITLSHPSRMKATARR